MLIPDKWWTSLKIYPWNCKLLGNSNQVDGGSDTMMELECTSCSWPVDSHRALPAMHLLLLTSGFAKALACQSHQDDWSFRSFQGNDNDNQETSQGIALIWAPYFGFVKQRRQWMRNSPASLTGPELHLNGSTLVILLLPPCCRSEEWYFLQEALFMVQADGRYPSHRFWNVSVCQLLKHDEGHHFEIRIVG